MSTSAADADARPDTLHSRLHGVEDVHTSILRLKPDNDCEGLAPRPDAPGERLSPRGPSDMTRRRIPASTQRGSCRRFPRTACGRDTSPARRPVASLSSRGFPRAPRRRCSAAASTSDTAVSTSASLRSPRARCVPIRMPAIFSSSKTVVGGSYATVTQIRFAPFASANSRGTGISNSSDLVRENRALVVERGQAVRAVERTIFVRDPESAESQPPLHCPGCDLFGMTR